MHSANFAMLKAINRMVIDHAHGLHEGVVDGRAGEAEASFLEILAYSLRKLRLGRR